MKGFAIACVLFSMLLVTVGCNQDTTQPAAQSPATDSSDRQEVMKPAIPADTPPEATTDEEPADDDSATKETEPADDDSATKETEPADDDSPAKESKQADDDSPAKESEPVSDDAATSQEAESTNP